MNILYDKWETNLNEDHMFSNYEIFNDKLNKDDITFNGKKYDKFYSENDRILFK